MLEGGINLDIAQPLAAQVETDLERAMPLGGTSPHRYGTVALVIDPVIAATVVEHGVDHFLLEALLTQAPGQLRLGALAPCQAAHGEGAGGGQLLLKGGFDGLGRVGNGFINHK